MASRPLLLDLFCGGIDWMGWRELKESIPPAYTEWIGRQLLEALSEAA